MRAMAKDATKKAAEAAREMLLGDRIPAIESLASAHADIDKIDERIERDRAARTEAVETARARYEDAQKAGWSTRELRRLGFAAPRGTGTRRSRTIKTDADSTTETHAPAADSTATETTDSAPAAVEDTSTTHDSENFQQHGDAS